MWTGSYGQVTYQDIFLAFVFRKGMLQTIRDWSPLFRKRQFDESVDYFLQQFPADRQDLLDVLALGYLIKPDEDFDSIETEVHNKVSELYENYWIPPGGRGGNGNQGNNAVRGNGGGRNLS